MFTLIELIIFGSCFLGIFFAMSQWRKISRISVFALSANDDNSEDAALNPDNSEDYGTEKAQQKTQQLLEIHDAISRGAASFIRAEYNICFLFLIGFGIVVLVLVGSAGNCNTRPNNNSCWKEGIFTAVSFFIGGITSMLSGYIGMKVAVYTNVRTACEAQKLSYMPAFNSAFRGGAVMGFTLCGLALGVLLLLINIYSVQFPVSNKTLFECIAGYGLGGSSIAMFGRVGGGIYTKAADVGADLVGKVEKNIPEDDPRNPAVIADNVGDNVGDVAGMGADLFGSFAEATCAALVLTSLSPDLGHDWNSLMFPLVISAIGIIVCLLTTYVATDISPVRGAQDVEKVLKYQLIISTILLTPSMFIATNFFLPFEFRISEIDELTSTRSDAFWCIATGLWSGLLIGLITEYYTSHSYTPVREVAQASKTGAATVIIYGLALGYKSNIIPVGALGATIFVSFRLCGMYGVALAALGMLSSLSIGLTIDAYGPITDNAGGIAEMAELGSQVRDVTDTLDAAGNTTAAIGKGFAIGSAALVSLALFGAYVSRIGETTVNILDPLVFAFLIYGSMLPYWFSAMTMKAVGIAAMEMVVEVREQFAQIPGLMEGKAKPNYERCVQIATNASLKQMVAPACLVIFAPLITGFFFGVYALSGLLAGGLASGVQMAISSSNTGGAFDNAKKYIEAGNLGGKGSESHKAAVVGDTVGDPLKDTSGPALNILMKLMAILSLVFADFFLANSLAAGKEWAGYEANL